MRMAVWRIYLLKNLNERCGNNNNILTMIWKQSRSSEDKKEGVVPGKIFKILEKRRDDHQQGSKR